MDWKDEQHSIKTYSHLLNSIHVMCSDKQLIQYTSCPLLAFLDGCTPPPEVDLSTRSSSAHLQPSSSSSDCVEAEPPSELLDSSLKLKQPAHSSLIHLEPLTEAEASQETLFYLCELSPAGPEADSTQLERVWAETGTTVTVMTLIQHRLHHFILQTFVC